MPTINYISSNRIVCIRYIRANQLRELITCPARSTHLRPTDSKANTTQCCVRLFFRLIRFFQFNSNYTTCPQRQQQYIERDRALSYISYPFRIAAFSPSSKNTTAPTFQVYGWGTTQTQSQHQKYTKTNIPLAEYPQPPPSNLDSALRTGRGFLLNNAANAY